MPSLHPVLWTKGTLLTPQHLQAQDRYHDDLLRAQLGALTFCPWGLTRLDVDREALAGGTLVVRAVAGRMSDGLLFDAPAADPTPPPRPLEGAWAQDQRAMLVSLAVPEYRPGARNIAADARAGGASTARWRAEEQLSRDETTGLAERPIQVARTNLRLLLDGDAVEGYTTLPVARLLRAPTGEVTLDPAFIPPLLDVAASDALTAIGRRVLERVAAKGAALAGSRRQRNQGLADFSITDVAAFWLLYTLNTHLPALRHLTEVRGGHPEPLWDALTALAGALTTFAPPGRPLPVYDHARLGDCFTQLEARLLELLETAVPESAIAIPLRAVAPAVQAAAIEQERWLTAPQWYLAVSAPVRQAELVSRVVHGCKVGSADVVDTLIRQALPGLELVHVPQPPAAVPVKLDYLYFAVGRAGPAWDAVARARNLAVYVPAELPGARLELVIVLQ
ncbi:type VI secretion system baseplate subunit TssK [Roseisolibacter sp. H3M3-2]|uniref:type VI secretion system baseplate subunit TssK n=1 Tax=Roseisolibacter sp. H3M3-2 TaxID=3031323 RepID=UPI0023DBA841|nr:type VI secretion system baseplate subunit TssK [Roseisolibacter sp. H3M3-2]MDF1504993.1 type VI secretion system baseplate subunit TssK [Roseisolibacter sp. H3M3-2]